MVTDIKYGLVVLDINEKLNIKYIDHGYTQLFGYTMDDVRNGIHTLEQMVHSDDLLQMREVLADAFQRKELMLTYFRVYTKDREEISVLLGVHAEESAGDSCFRGFFVKEIDIPRQDVKKAFANIKGLNPERIMIRQSVFDELTGFLNEVATRVTIGNFLMKASKENFHVFFLVAIDNLKELNSALGYVFGDSMLENISNGIRNLFRDTDILGRIGGNEFLICMKDADANSVYKKAEEILQLFDNENRNNLDADAPQLIGHIGISIFPMDGMIYNTLLQNADMALQMSRQSERSNYMVYSDSEEKSLFSKDETTEQPQLQEEETRISRIVGAYDMELIAFAFDLLTSTKDVCSAIHLLLDRIGRQFRLDKISILENKNNESCLETTMVWEMQESIEDKNEKFQIYDYEYWRNLPRQFDNRGMLVLDDCSMLKTGNGGVDLWALQAQSMISCSFYNERGFYGCINYMVKTKIRNWNGKEKESFLELTKLISYFLMRHRELQAYSVKIEHLENFDQVTGLSHLNFFKEEVREFLKKEENQNNKYAIVYSDIHNFFYINEQFGYEQGDRLLCAFADKMARENPHCKKACRIFSDFFLFLYEITSKESLLYELNEINRVFVEEQQEFYSKVELSSVSGVCLLDEEGMGITEAIDNANIARKSIKSDRRVASTCFDDRLKQKKSREVTALSTLKAAMDGGEIVPYLQPKVSLKTKKIIGIEALVRWKKEDGTVMSPNDFVPVLENTGLIVDLDYFMYEQVLILLRKWLDEGKNVVPISVNLSRVHGNYDNFGTYLLERALYYQIPFHLIEFEVTESAFANNADRIIQKLDILRGVGFRMSIDDFGIGYSSLSMLYDVPADVIKMDKSFLDDSFDVPEKRDLIRLIIEMAHTVHKAIVFEGVETEEQLDFLTECGCNAVQGYIYAKPMSVEVFEQIYLS